MNEAAIEKAQQIFDAFRPSTKRVVAVREVLDCELTVEVEFDDGTTNRPSGLFAVEIKRLLEPA